MRQGARGLSEVGRQRGKLGEAAGELGQPIGGGLDLRQLGPEAAPRAPGSGREQAVELAQERGEVLLRRDQAFDDADRRGRRRPRIPASRPTPPTPSLKSVAKPGYNPPSISFEATVMMHRRAGLRGRPGAALSENIVIVLLMVFVGVGLVTVFGQNIARRFQGVTKGLDDGKPIAKTERSAPQNNAEIGGPGNAPIVGGPLPAVAAPANAAAGTNPGYGGAAARTPDRTPANTGISLAHPRGWDPQDMLAGMTQIDQNLVHTTNFDPMRCACASALASRIMAGPDAVDRMLADLMLRAQNGTLPNSTAGPPPTIGGMPRDQYISQLGALRDRLAAQSLNHADLGLIQELLYQGHSIVPGVQGTYFYTAGGPQNYQQMMTLGNGVDPAGARIGAPNSGNNQAVTVNQAQLATNMTNLSPGESMTLGIGAPGHFIVVGRDAAGRPYLYDPWPFVGTAGNPAPPQLTYDPAVLDWYMNNQMPPGGFIQYSPVRH